MAPRYYSSQDDLGHFEAFFVFSEELLWYYDGDFLIIDLNIIKIVIGELI